MEIAIFRVVTNKNHKPMAYFKLQNGLKFKFFYDDEFREFSRTEMIADINYQARKSLPNHRLLLEIDEFIPIQKVSADTYKKILFNTTEI